MKSISLAVIGLSVAALPLAAQQGTAQAADAHQGFAQSTYCRTMQDGMTMMGMWGTMNQMHTGNMMGSAMGAPRSGMRGANMMHSTSVGPMPAADVMNRAVRLSPRYLIQQRDELGLNNSQVSKLEVLARREENQSSRSKDIDNAQQHLAQAFDGLDSRGLRSAASDIARIRGEQLADELALAADASRILTPQQREQADGLSGACPVLHSGSGMGSGQSMQGSGIR